jgi:hypothetical protein
LLAIRLCGFEVFYPGRWPATCNYSAWMFT